MRKLATIRRIEDKKPIEGADKIEAYRVLGWWVVDRKDAYNIGDLVVYCEVDSWIPNVLAPFLSKDKEPRVYNDVKGERLKTVKLRGQLSQGLLLSVNYVDAQPFITGNFMEDGIGTMVMVEEGQDVTDELSIQKWERPVPAQLQGISKGYFPTNIVPKTDQERIQNCFEDIYERSGDTYEVTMKLDGSSMTVFRKDNELRVCSRNLELKNVSENSDNLFVKMANEIGDKIPEGFAFQGELMGEGIQGNRERIIGHKFYIFDVYDIHNGYYLNAEKRIKLCDDFGLNHVPVLSRYTMRPMNVNHALTLTEGPSINHNVREGTVWKSERDPNFSFKVISNKFLLKEK